MKLAITHPYSWPDVRRGAERIVVETARALAARGHAVTILTSGWQPVHERQDGIETIKLRRRFKDSYRHELSFALRILPKLITGHYEAVHSMMPLDALAAAVTRRLGGHTVLYDEMGIPDRGWWANQPEGWARRIIVRKVDVYACMSQFALDALRRDWNRGGALVPGGVRVESFAPAKSRERVPTILFSGLLDDPRKGVEDLLSAAVILARSRPDLKVWLSGPGDPRAILSRVPEAAGIAEHLPVGDPSSQAERYGRAWVTCLPSVSESFGLVLIESLACGTPIVVVDDAAPPSLVTPETGCVAKPHDPQSLARSLDDALELAQQIDTARLCRGRAEEFDWDSSIAPLLERLYVSGRDPIAV
ncbi:MAG TPA: glycosyltransferase family 4 protein [Acidimicrobiales bacterium]|nr:glycosyltransferase family 4 protein [Acidimicrobiales bacterium]